MKLTENTVEVTIKFGRDEHAKDVNRCQALGEFSQGKVVRCDYPEGHSFGHFSWDEGVKHYWSYQTPMYVS